MLEGHVPEGIFRNPFTQQIISVEVKRIVGNSLPKTGGGRKLIRRRKHIIWPCMSTIVAALEKANEAVVKKYNVEEHYICIVVPETLDKKSFEKIHYHICIVMKKYFETHIDECMKPNKIKLYIVKGPSHLFDRF